MEEPLVSRDEVASLFFNVSDIARTLERIEDLLKEDGDDEEEADGG
jgi:hypothetical protein